MSTYLIGLKQQETARFRSLIRQHVDLEMIRTKLEGAGFYNFVEFFRDLLLLCNNAIVFFPKDSLEYTTAVDFREYVKKEVAANINVVTTPTTTTTTVKKMNKNKPHISSTTEPNPSSIIAPKKSLSAKSKSVSEADDLVSEKPKIRTSVSPKRTSVSPKRDLEKELEDVDKKKRERPAVARGLRTTKARGASMKKRINAEVDGDCSQEPTKPTEKKTNGSGGSGEVATIAAKKRSAVSFLDRLNNTSTLSPPSDNVSMSPRVKNAGSGTGKREQKRGGKTADKKKVQGGGVRHIGGRNKQAVTVEEESTPTKRSVGRPPKKPPPTRKAQTSSKRAREPERETLSQSSPVSNKKRSKR